MKIIRYLTSILCGILFYSCGDQKNIDSKNIYVDALRNKACEESSFSNDLMTSDNLTKIMDCTKLSTKYPEISSLIKSDEIKDILINLNALMGNEKSQINLNHFLRTSLGDNSLYKALRTIKTFMKKKEILNIIEILNDFLLSAKNISPEKVNTLVKLFNGFEEITSSNHQNIFDENLIKQLIIDFKKIDLRYEQGILSQLNSNSHFNFRVWLDESHPLQNQEFWKMFLDPRLNVSLPILKDEMHMISCDRLNIMTYGEVTSISSTLLNSDSLVISSSIYDGLSKLLTLKMYCKNPTLNTSNSLLGIEFVANSFLKLMDIPYGIDLISSIYKEFHLLSPTVLQDILLINSLTKLREKFSALNPDVQDERIEAWSEFLGHHGKILGQELVDILNKHSLSSIKLYVSEADQNAITSIAEGAFNSQMSYASLLTIINHGINSFNLKTLNLDTDFFKVNQILIKKLEDPNFKKELIDFLSEDGLLRVLESLALVKITGVKPSFDESNNQSISVSLETNMMPYTPMLFDSTCLKQLLNQAHEYGGTQVFKLQISEKCHNDYSSSSFVGNYLYWLSNSIPEVGLGVWNHETIYFIISLSRNLIDKFESTSSNIKFELPHLEIILKDLEFIKRGESLIGWFTENLNPIYQKRVVQKPWDLNLRPGKGHINWDDVNTKSQIFLKLLKKAVTRHGGENSFIELFSKKIDQNIISIDQIMRFIKETSRAKTSVKIHNNYGGYTVEDSNILSKLEHLLKNISFNNNFYTNYFINKLATSSDFKQEIESSQKMLKWLPRGGKVFRFFGSFENDTKYRIANVMDSFEVFEELFKNKNISPESIDCLHQIIKIIYETSSSRSRSYSLFRRPKAKFLSGHNTSLLTDISHLGILSTLSQVVNEIETSDTNINLDIKYLDKMINHPNLPLLIKDTFYYLSQTHKKPLDMAKYLALNSNLFIHGLKDISVRLLNNYHEISKLLKLLPELDLISLYFDHGELFDMDEDLINLLLHPTKMHEFNEIFTLNNGSSHSLIWNTAMRDFLQNPQNLSKLIYLISTPDFWNHMSLISPMLLESSGNGMSGFQKIIDEFLGKSDLLIDFLESSFPSIELRD